MNPALKIEGSGNNAQVIYQHRKLYQEPHTAANAEKRVSRFSCPSHTLVLVPSPLLGYGINLLISRLKQLTDTHILCVELEPTLATLSAAHIDPSLLNNRHITWCLPCGEDQVVQLFQMIQTHTYKRIQVLTLNNGYSLNHTKYRELLEKLQRAIRVRWHNKLTLVRMGRLWMRNIFRNLTLFPSFSDVYRLTTQHPIIVVGAGAGAEENINFLAHCQHKACIIAVDTAVSTLLAYNIVPHLIVVVEAQQHNVIDLINIVDRDMGCAFGLDISAHPASHRIAAAVGGNRYGFASRFAPIHFFSQLHNKNIVNNVIPALGSVGCVALYIAMHMHSRVIFVTGLDCSYTIGKTHIKGSPQMVWSAISATRLNADPLARLCLNRPTIDTTGKGGKHYKTELNLIGYAEQIRTLAQRCTSSLYDLSHYGLPLAIPALDLGTAVDIIERTSASIDTPVLTHTQDTSTTLGSRSKNGRLFVEYIAQSLRQYINYASGRNDNVHPTAKLDSAQADFAQLDFIHIDTPQDTTLISDHGIRSAQDYLHRINSLLAAT